MLKRRSGLYRLPDDALVVRGGELKILDVAQAIDLCWTEHGVYGLSVWAAETPDVPALCALVPILPHAQVCWTTAGMLRALDGVELVSTRAAPHYTLVIPNSESDTVEGVRDCFSNPIPNPKHLGT
jgi:hypothetical protein